MSESQKLGVDVDHAVKALDSIKSMVVWSASPQGMGYWNEVCTRIHALIKEVDPKRAGEDFWHSV